MDPRPLSSFLDKFKKRMKPKKHIKEVLEAFLESKGKVNDLTLRGGVLYVKTVPMLKQQLFLKKKECLLYLKNNLKEIVVVDIR